MPQAAILDYLADEGAVLTGQHFIYTKGGHGTAYIDMRSVAHQTEKLAEFGTEAGDAISKGAVDLVIGPETLGRTLVDHAALRLGVPGIWCDIVGEGSDKHAAFSPKLNFGRLVEGKRVAIVDDLLTTGGSIKMVAELIIEHGGIPVIAVAVVRRTPNVTADDCGVQELKVLADVPGFVLYSPEECAEKGPCSQRVPVVLRPGHGHEWIRLPENVGYPTA